MVRRAVCPEFTADDHERITTTPPPSLDFRVAKLWWTWKTGLIKTAHWLPITTQQDKRGLVSASFFAKLDWYNSLWRLVDVYFDISTQWIETPKKYHFPMRIGCRFRISTFCSLCSKWDFFRVFYPLWLFLMEGHIYSDLFDYS